MSTATRIGVVGALILAIGCNADDLATNERGLSPLFDRDVVQVAGDAAAEDVELMGGPGGLLGFGFAAAPEGPIHGHFRCEGRTREGLTVTRSCTFKDASGNVQAEYDPLTTAEAQIQVAIEGAISREMWEAEVERTRNLTVTGLAGEETRRTWNGTGSGSVSRSRHREGGETRTYDLTYQTTIVNVVVPVPRTEDSWPISGTITRNARATITGGPADGRVVERVVVITFNGTRFVPVTVNGKSFTFDLRIRRVVRED
jgi:hypothetical protein